MLQAPVVQTMDSAIHRINQYLVDISHSETNYCCIQWIVIYLVDSVIHLLNNWGQMFKPNINTFVKVWVVSVMVTVKQ